MFQFLGQTKMLNDVTLLNRDNVIKVNKPFWVEQLFAIFILRRQMDIHVMHDQG